MSSRKQLWKNATRVAAGVNLLWNFASVPRPPSLDPAAQMKDMQTQWAKNEEINVLPSRRRHAVELGYELREPDSAEYRLREDASRRRTADTRTTHEHTKDVHDRVLADASPRPKARTERRREGKER